MDNFGKNLIFCAFAFDSAKKSSQNLRSVSADKKLDIYLQNMCVSLISAKKTNPNCDVALVASEVLPQKYFDILSKHNIAVFNEKFDEFLFPGDMLWSLAFYKLNVLSKITKYGYSNYLMVDTDVYFQSAVNDLWEETQSNIMLYDINHRPSAKNCHDFHVEYCNLMGNADLPYITNYGGEFVAASHDNLVKFMNECTKIYNEMSSSNFTTRFGDEFILRIAASRMRQEIKNASGYIFRFWTGSYRLVSTSYQGAVSVLHVPGEKKRGMLKLFKCVSRIGSFPKNTTVHKILHLSRIGLKYKIGGIALKVLRR